jgi:hypothetical protein
MKMMKKKVIICLSLASILILVASFSGCISGRKIYDYSELEYPANENTILEVNNINGMVNISGWEEETIFLEIVKFTNKIYGQDEFEKVDVIVTENGDKVSIDVEYSNPHTPVRVAVTLNIKVPMFVTVESVQTLNGAVYLSNIKGDTDIDVKNGLISVCTVDGFVSASTANGAINIRNTKGLGNIINYNGAVYAEVNDIQEDIEISTINGEMDIFINTELDANIEVEAKSIAAGINLYDLEPYLDLSINNYRHLVGTIGEGGNNLYLCITTGFINLNKL